MSKLEIRTKLKILKLEIWTKLKLDLGFFPPFLLLLPFHLPQIRFRFFMISCDDQAVPSCATGSPRLAVHWSRRRPRELREGERVEREQTEREKIGRESRSGERAEEREGEREKRRRERVLGRFLYEGFPVILQKSGY